MQDNVFASKRLELYLRPIPEAWKQYRRHSICLELLPAKSSQRRNSNSCWKLQHPLPNSQLRRLNWNAPGSTNRRAIYQWKALDVYFPEDFTVRHFAIPGASYDRLNAGGSGYQTVHLADSAGMIQEELRRFSWNDPGRPSRRAIYQQKSMDVYFPGDFTVHHFAIPGEIYGRLNAGGSGYRTVHLADQPGMI